MKISVFAPNKMRISDRYLSSKIDYSKGEWRGIPFESYEVFINFIAGKSEEDRKSMTYKKTVGTKEEAEKIQANALKIISTYLKNPNDPLLQTTVYSFE